ncbi:MAG: hypothetical protein IKO93_00175 [Lentisphaeria bacterium]|nr:hypothetical protein [Lentisphaeria bacterium]
MRFFCLPVLWSMAAFLLAGCAVYGAKESYSTPEESLRSPSLLFRDKHLLGNDEENTQDYQNVFYSLWDADDHAYCYFLQEISLKPKNGRPHEKEIRINSNSVAKIRYFRYQDNCYADIQFDNDETRLHHLCLVGVLGRWLVFLNYAPLNVLRDQQAKSDEKFELVKENNNLKQIVIKGDSARLKAMIGEDLFPVFEFKFRLDIGKLPEDDSLLFGKAARERFLQHYTSLIIRHIRTMPAKEGRQSPEKEIAFFRKCLAEPNTAQLSPEAVKRASRQLDEAEKLLNEKFPKPAKKTQPDKN